MGWSLRLAGWSSIEPGLLAAIKQLARDANGRRTERIDDAWWDRTSTIVPPVSNFALQYGYSSRVTTSLESVLDDSLGMQRWRANNEGVDQFVVFPPFMFSVDAEPPFWARVAAGDLRALLGVGVVLMDHYAGAYENDAGRTYLARGKAAFEQLDALQAPPDDDIVDEDHFSTLFYGVEYAMDHLLHEAWELEVPVVLYW